MKKILGTTLAAALLIPGPANAEILKNLKVNGQLDIQGTSARNASDFATRGDQDGNAVAVAGVVTAAPTNDNSAKNDRIGTVATRLLVDLSWDLLDDVHSVVTLRKNDRAWGAASNGVTGQPASGSQAINGAPGVGAGVLGNTMVDRAAITIDKLFGHVDTTLGRQYYGDAGDLIIYAGPKDTYGLFSTSIDAARFEMANDWMAFSGLAAKTANTTASFAAGTTDTNVRGFDILWKSMPLKAHTYVWNQVTQAAGALGSGAGKNDNLWVYGLKLRGEAMGGWLNADIAANGGEDRTSLAGACIAGGRCNATGSNYTGKALLLDAGYNAEVSGVGALTPWVNFGWGTGRSSNFETRNEGFTAIASDYRPGIMNRRFAGAAGIGAMNLGAGTGTGIGTNGLNNRVVYGAGLNVTPAAWEKLTLGAQLWHFNRQRNTSTIANSAAGVETGAKHLGAEYGITADWKHSENVKFGLGGSVYQPGGFVKQTIRNANGLTATNATNNTSAAFVGNNPATLAFADFQVKF